MITVAHDVTDLQLAYLKSLALQWKCSRSRVLREIIQEHMLAGSTTGGSMRNSTLPDRDSDDLTDDDKEAT